MSVETIDLIQQLGFPIFVAVALMYIIVKGLQWLGKEIFKPIRDRLLIHFDTVDRFLKDMPEAVEKMEVGLQQQSELLRESVKDQQEMTSLLEKLHEKLHEKSTV